MNNIIRNSIATIVILLAGVSVSSLAGCSGGETPEVQAMKTGIKQMEAERANIEKNLSTFDTLDYTVFTNQEWTRLHESHAQDIKVNWPDGHFTTGIDKHIEDLKAMFVYAPNTSIKQHPLRFGSGNMSCVTGIMTGTFSAPMPIGGGKFIQPTGKSFSLPMCTVGIWKDGVMTEEYLFWDNQTYLKQIGLAQ
jgi:hypothetical protein